jgi:4-amino-4-deoxy-L-arabinose transferase-like glycosyltransferase
MSLRGVGRTDAIDTDAARHAMNGAFIYDLLRTGHWSSPIEYAKSYYGQYPAISMPYHPPLFPAIEALLFAVFGVKLFTARLAIAIAAAASAALLYQLARSTLGHSLLAACVTIATFSLWTVQQVSHDVMLELPALAFSLAAVLCLRDLERSYPMRRALCFALLAAAAVWTKQHTVFLGGIPILHAVLTRRWRRLVGAPLLVSTLLFSVAVLALIRLSGMFHGTGIDQLSTSSSDVYWIYIKTLPKYYRWITAGLKGFPGLFAAAALGVYAWSARMAKGNRPKLALYFAWIIALSALLIDLGPVSPRYLVLMFPATVMIGYAWLFHGCRTLWNERIANRIVGGFAAAWFAVGLFAPIESLQGPGAAAEAVVQGTPARMLYVGPADGNFVFAVRALDPQLQMAVLPAAKLPRKMVEDMGIETFCRRYGIEWVIFENVVARHYWDKLHEGLQASAGLVKTVPLESNRSRWRDGSVEVYRFASANNHFKDVLPLPVVLPSGKIALK